jgi:hypothetical protein
MPDKLPGKLILFGQCAGGEYWENKTFEMQPDKFWANWMLDSQISPLVRTFYVPHRINCEELDYWTITVRDAGILFDRCRVAYWAFQDNARVVTDARYYAWCRSIFPSLIR